MPLQQITMLREFYDILVCHQHVFNMSTTFPTKSVGEPDDYLGAKLKLKKLVNGVWVWDLGLSKYVQEAVCNCENYVGENLPKFYKFTCLVPNTFPTDYFQS